MVCGYCVSFSCLLLKELRVGVESVRGMLLRVWVLSCAGDLLVFSGGGCDSLV